MVDNNAMADDNFHPSEFIQDELTERGWTLDFLASQMSGDYTSNRLSLDIYFNTKHPELRMGGKIIKDLARIFGTSESVWRNLEKQWHSQQEKKDG